MVDSLKVLRVRKGVTQNELAANIAVSQTTVSAWEQGKVIPSSKNIYKLAEYLAVKPDVIYCAVFDYLR